MWCGGSVVCVVMAGVFFFWLDGCSRVLIDLLVIVLVGVLVFGVVE